MVFRQRLGLSVPPVLLRIALAMTFIWAGASKFMAPMALSPEQEATLLEIRSGATPTDAPTETPPDFDDAAPAEIDEDSVAMERGYTLTLVQDGDAPTEPPAESLDAAPDATAEADASPTYTGKDMLTIDIKEMATPNAEGKALLPAFMGRGKMPIWIALSVSLVELIGGVLILLGLLTRVSSLMIAGVMVGAIWLTSIGPVVIYGNSGWPRFLQILPAIDYSTQGNAMETFAAWQSWTFQLAMLMASLSLACLGPGSISLDRIFFKKPGPVVATEYDDDGDGDE